MHQQATDRCAGDGAPRVLDLRGVGLRFAGGVEALASIDLVVGEGEFVAIVGPSGCGKSTLLRLVAGLIRPTTGELFVDGMLPAEARRRTTEFSLVFQSPTLLPWRSVRRNVVLPLELRGGGGGGGRAERAARADVALELVGLAEFAGALPHELSGGMRMRAALARALVTRPRLLLLDEPFGALDDITRQRLNEELLGLRTRDAWTALLVTHHVAEAVFLSHRVVVMSARPGRIVADVAVPFAFPRGPELRGEAAFARLTAEIGRRLREAHA